MKPLDKLLNSRDLAILRILKHSHYGENKDYEYKVGLTKRPDLSLYDWLNHNTVDCYSTDSKTKPWSLSFKNAGDAVKFKLRWSGDLAASKYGA